MVITIPIDPKYRRENGLWVLDIESIVSKLDFSIVEKSVVALPSAQVGGNHKHPRVEGLMALGYGVMLVWLDERGERRRQAMEEFTVYIVSSELPHAVINESGAMAYLLEFADQPQHDVTSVSIV